MADKTRIMFSAENKAMRTIGITCILELIYIFMQYYSTFKAEGMTLSKHGDVLNLGDVLNQWVEERALLGFR